MLHSVIDGSLRNRLLVLLVTVVLIGAGLRAFYYLPVDVVPDLTDVQIQVLTKLPGVAPVEVEKSVTFPIEQSMAGIAKLKQIRSLSQFGLSFVTLVFEEGTDIGWARNQVSQRLAVARSEIPKHMGTPLMGPLSTGLGEIYQFELKSSRHNAMQLRTMLDWYVSPPLRLVKGVVEVNSFGGQLKTYEVRIDAQKMRRLRVSIGDVYRALSQDNHNVGGGYIRKAGEQYIVRGEGVLRSREDIESLPVKVVGSGVPVLVRHVASVVFAPMIRQGNVTRDGRGEAVTGTIMMLQGANAAFVIQRVKKKLKEIQAGLPKGVTIDVFYDRSLLIRRTLRTVRNNLLEGGLLVVIILFLLLGNLRGGLLVALTIPLSLLFAFICMRWMGITGNLMSLGAIDFGMIVDGSVVMVEHIILAFGLERYAASSTVERVQTAAKEVARPLLFSVGIIMVVYLPILTLQGSEGKLFRPMAWTLLFALGGALLLSLTLMPVLASFVFRTPPTQKETLLMRFFRSLYRPLLTFVMRFRYLTITVAIAVLLLGGWLLSTMGANFIPKLDEGMIAIQANRLPSVSLEESMRHTSRIETVLKQIPEVVSVISKTGRAEVATDPMGVFTSDIFVVLQPRHKWRSGLTRRLLVAEMKQQLDQQSPGNSYAFSQPIALRTAELLSGVRADVAVKLFGNDLRAMPNSAHAIAAILRKVPGAADVVVEPSAGLPYLRLALNRREMARHGISSTTVLRTIQAIGGVSVGTVLENEKRFALRIRFQKSDRKHLASIQQLPVSVPGGGILPLRQVAHIWFEKGPLQIQREQGKRRVTILLNIRGRDMASFVADAKQHIRQAITSGKLVLPEGSFLAWGGQFEQLESASQRLLLVVPLALLLIFLLLQMTFRSVRLSVLIFLNVPIAISGGVFALALRGMPLSISAAIGGIALSGIAVMNGVLLMSAIQSLQADGMPRREAVWEGAMGRLRPVLMTALTDAIGFLPMALSTSAGAEVQRPLATVVIGGIFTSTALTLLVLPTVYCLWGGSEPEQSENSTEVDVAIGV